MSEPDRTHLARLEADLTAAIDKLKAYLPTVAEARRTYAKSRSDEALATLVAVETHAQKLDEHTGTLLKEVEVAAGITTEQLEAHRAENATGDSVARVLRGQLTANNVSPFANIHDVLERNLEGLLRKIGPKQLAQVEASDTPRLLPGLISAPLSLVRGVRPETESASTHRFAQSMRLTLDYLAGNEGYDAFSGAMLVPQIAALASKLEVLSALPGANKKLRSLWNGPSSEFDSTTFELLVAARCSEMGRSVRFVQPQSSPTQDLMCDDPYPLAIECKRKRPLSQYELDEERSMRTLFEQLEAAARRAGMWGSFEIELLVEHGSMPTSEIVRCAMLQRFAGGAGRLSQYGWGSVGYSELASRIDLPGPTRLYSPAMLSYVFGWDTDLSTHDGLICRVANTREAAVDVAERPVALLWSNTSDVAVMRRSFTPLSLYREALEQIPDGDFGIIYVAYQDGARADIADARMTTFMASLKESDHRASIRVPLVNLVRLYPRALGDGGPDLIESTMNFVANYGDDVLPTVFPSRVFTAT